MLEYDWGNPAATVIFAGDEPTHDSDQSRQIFDHYAQAFNETLVNPSHGFGISHHQQHFHQPQATQHHHTQTTTQTHLHSLYDPRAFAASYQPPPSPAMLSLEPIGGVSAGPAGFMVVPKSEPGGGGSVIDFASRIGLNLGGRTYFSSSEDDFVNRLYRRSRQAEPVPVNSPRCQAEGCNADLTHAKHYHRRHKVCEFHSKAATVIAAGLTQRFCQQCSRFHLLSEFDNGKRSCRKRLADHNRRRRKSHHQSTLQEPKSEPQGSRNPPSENTANKPHIWSPADSGAQSSSSVTVAVSPPRISLDCLGYRSSYQATATTSSPSTSSLFFSNG